MGKITPQSVIGVKFDAESIGDIPRSPFSSYYLLLRQLPILEKVTKLKERVSYVGYILS